MKYAISGLRQDYREVIPKLMSEQFSRKLKDHEWAAMFRGFGKTDLAVMGRLRVEKLRELVVDKSARTNEIQKLEEDLRSSQKARFRTIQSKARDLARYMVTEEIAPGNNSLLRNAYTIAHLFDDKGYQKVVPDAVVAQVGVLLAAGRAGRPPAGHRA